MFNAKRAVLADQFEQQLHLAPFRPWVRAVTPTGIPLFRFTSEAPEWTAWFYPDDQWRFVLTRKATREPSEYRFGRSGQGARDLIEEMGVLFAEIAPAFDRVGEYQKSYLCGAVMMQMGEMVGDSGLQISGLYLARQMLVLDKEDLAVLRDMFHMLPAPENAAETEVKARLRQFVVQASIAALGTPPEV